MGASTACYYHFSGMGVAVSGGYMFLQFSQFVQWGVIHSNLESFYDLSWVLVGVYGWLEIIILSVMGYNSCLHFFLDWCTFVCLIERMGFHPYKLFPVLYVWHAMC